MGLLLATSPVFIFSTTVAAPNGLEMAAALALWCLLLEVPDIGDPRTERRMVILAVASACVLVSLRLLGPLFVILIVLLAMVFHGRTAFSFVVRRRRLLVVAAGSVCLATAAAAAWSLRAGLVKGSGEPQGEAEWSPNSIVLWPMQTIAAFPYRDQPGPIFIYPLIGGVVCLFAYLAWRTARGSRRLALALALGAALALPFVLTWVSKDGRGVMWQGRYGLPLAVGFVVIAGLILDRSRRRPSRGLLLGGALALAACTAACLVKIVHSELAREVSATDSAWLSPPSWLLIAGALVAWLSLAVAISVPSLRWEQTT